MKQQKSAECMEDNSREFGANFEDIMLVRRN